MTSKSRQSGLTTTITVSTCSGCDNVTANNSVLQPGFRETTIGGETPAFQRVRRAGGLLPINTFRQTYEELSSASGSWDITSIATCGSGAHQNCKASYTGVLWGPKVLPTLTTLLSQNISELKQEAISNLYTKDSWDALTFLGELRDTIRMFRAVQQKLVAFHAYVEKARARGVFRTVANMNKSVDEIIGNLWLEYRYGWRTLWMDMQTAFAAYKRVDQKGHVFRGRGQLIIPVHEVRSRSEDWNFSGVDIVTEISGEWSQRVGALSLIAPPKVRFDALITGYELIPFSFVLDWFVNIGRLLEAIYGRAHHSDVVLWYGTALNYVAQTTYRLNQAAAANPTYTGSLVEDSIWLCRIETRDPIGTHVLSAPTLGANLNLAKGGDLLALFNQQAKRLSRR